MITFALSQSDSVIKSTLFNKITSARHSWFIAAEVNGMLFAVEWENIYASHIYIAIKNRFLPSL